MLVRPLKAFFAGMPILWFTSNEPNQPRRAGATADELRAELAVIIDWLAVDKATHLRYQPLV
jgi:hypothetical protein